MSAYTLPSERKLLRLSLRLKNCERKLCGEQKQRLMMQLLRMSDVE
jgi:hypothetical protein